MGGPETTLNLGQFQFGAMEIPGEIRFGGAQRLAVHELVGGARVIDAMGRSDRALEWSGLLLGNGAIDRARFLDGLRVAGQQLSLAWSAFSYQVVVREFEATYNKRYQLAYRIVCEVVADLTSPVTTPGATPIDQAISDDAAKAAVLVAVVADPTLTSKMGALSSAIAAVSKFASAAQSTINAVLQPLAAAHAQVTILIAATANVIGNVTTFGGVLPNNPLAQAAAKLTGQVASVTQASALYNLRNVLGRMGNNLGAVNAAPQTVATAGGNLFDIARKAYGDITGWTGIAKANKLTDPFISGSRVLTIPPAPDGANGVLEA